MDSRDWILLGLVGVGGYCAWRMWRGRPVVNAQMTVPSSTAGMVASSMTDSAARSTVFGGASLTKRIFGPVMVSKPLAARLPAPTAPGTVVAARQAAHFQGELRKVTDATFAPVAVAPSGSAMHFVATGILGFEGTSPSGDGGQPGDPSPQQVVQTRGIG